MNISTSKLIAWSIHAYTAFGGVVGFFALILASNNRFSEAFLLLLVSMIIDGTDGLLARKFNVSSVLTKFDGAMLDNVIDIFTYAWIPCFILYKLGVLNPSLLIICPILASLYAYGQTEMKTEDNYFLGFPTYWSIVALYVYGLGLSNLSSSIIVVIFSILSFVPTRYLYPSKSGYLKNTFFVLGVVWFILVVLGLLDLKTNRWLIQLSTFYPLLYIGLSFWRDYKLRP